MQLIAPEPSRTIAEEPIITRVMQILVPPARSAGPVGIPFATVLVLFLVFPATVGPAAAQSLADIARQEEARRKTVGPAAKVYSNDDLSPVPPPPAAPTGASSGSDPQAASGGAGSAPADGAAAVPPEPAAAEAGTTPTLVKDEAYWRKRLSGLREALERDRSYAEAMQTRVNVLTSDFSSRDDPAQRARIGVERQKALAELDRLKGSIENGKKAIADTEEEARRAGAPAGWLR
jgi:hypothetical protein